MHQYDIIEGEGKYVFYENMEEVTQIQGPCEITFEGDNGPGDFSRVKLPEVEISKITFHNCTVDLDYPYIPRHLRTLRLDDVRLVGGFTRKMSVDHLIVNNMCVDSPDAFGKYFEKATRTSFEHAWDAVACVIPDTTTILETQSPAINPEIAEVVMEEYPNLRSLTMQLDSEKDLAQAIMMSPGMDVTHQAGNMFGIKRLIDSYKAYTQV
jgi:hypothetical protein